MGDINIDPSVLLPEFTWKKSIPKGVENLRWIGDPKDDWDQRCLGGQGITAIFSAIERDLSGDQWYPGCYGKGGGGWFFSLSLEAENGITSEVVLPNPSILGCSSSKRCKVSCCAANRACM